MSSILPQLSDRPAGPEGEPRVLEVGHEETDGVFDALASDTARRVFATLHDEPSTASEVARRIDSSVQNVHYHLSNLQSAGLVDGVDTVYSEKGNEMTVYAPACDPLVLVGDADHTPGLGDVLPAVGLAVGLVALVSVAVQFGVERVLSRPDGAAGVAGASDVGGTPSDPAPLVAALAGVEPGLLVFAAGLLVVALVLSGWYLGRVRR